MKKNTGVSRIVKALHYSCQGLHWAFKSEQAFRQEVIVVAILVPLACSLPISTYERLALIVSLLWVLVVELLNSALEAAVDRVGYEFHALAGRAKDMGSAAVLLSILIAVVIWVVILYPYLKALL